jgi:hypothetical protein
VQQQNLICQVNAIDYHSISQSGPWEQHAQVSTVALQDFVSVSHSRGAVLHYLKSNHLLHSNHALDVHKGKHRPYGEPTRGSLGTPVHKQETQYVTGKTLNSYHSTQTGPRHSLPSMHLLSFADHDAHNLV